MPTNGYFIALPELAVVKYAAGIGVIRSKQALSMSEREKMRIKSLMLKISLFFEYFTYGTCEREDEWKKRRFEPIPGPLELQNPKESLARGIRQLSVSVKAITKFQLSRLLFFIRKRFSRTYPLYDSPAPPIFPKIRSLPGVLYPFSHKLRRGTLGKLKKFFWKSEKYEKKLPIEPNF